MRLLCMIFTTAVRNFNTKGLPPTTKFVRNNNVFKVVNLSPKTWRTIVRRLQKTILQELLSACGAMSNPFQTKEQENTKDESQFAAHRKDKPDANCRTCNDFKSWSKQQRLLSNKPAVKENHMAGEKLTANAHSPVERDDCPLDKARLGISTWGLLHTMAAFYSDNPTDCEKRDMKTFFDVLSRLYPCEYCAKDFRNDLNVNPINVSSQKELATWLCKFHNRVNDKLGKPLFDCSKVNERWRDGWLDGSCD